MLNVAHLLASYDSSSAPGARYPIKSEHVCLLLQCPAQQGIFRCSHEPRPMRILSLCDLASRCLIPKIVQVNSRNCCTIHTIMATLVENVSPVHLTHPSWDPGICLLLCNLPWERRNWPIRWPPSHVNGRGPSCMVPIVVRQKLVWDD